MIADIAIAADDGAVHDVSEGPDARAVADGIRFAEREPVDEGSHPWRPFCWIKRPKLRLAKGQPADRCGFKRAGHAIAAAMTAKSAGPFLQNRSMERSFYPFGRIGTRAESAGEIGENGEMQVNRISPCFRRDACRPPRLGIHSD